MSIHQTLIDYEVSKFKNAMDELFENAISDPNVARKDFDSMFEAGVDLTKFGSDIISRARMEEYNAQSINNLDSLEIEEESAELELEE